MIFETVAYIHIKNKKVLLTRSKGKTAFYMPGGKRDAGESDIQALTREIEEELSLSINMKTLRLYGQFEAQAYGMPEGVKVRIYCYTGTYAGLPKPCNEIEEIRFFSQHEYLSMPETAPAVCLILDDLKLKKLIN